MENGTCPYHSDTILDCQKALLLAEEGRADVSEIFKQMHDMQTLTAETREILITLKENGHSALGLLHGINLKFEDHLRDYNLVKQEVADFKWFRTGMNFVHNNILWVIVAAFLVVVMTSIFGWDVVNRFITALKP